jgi:hypothetical protein
LQSRHNGGFISPCKEPPGCATRPTGWCVLCSGSVAAEIGCRVDFVRVSWTDGGKSMDILDGPGMACEALGFPGPMHGKPSPLAVEHVQARHTPASAISTIPGGSGGSTPLGCSRRTQFGQRRWRCLDPEEGRGTSYQARAAVRPASLRAQRSEGPR